MILNQKTNIHLNFANALWYGIVDCIFNSVGLINTREIPCIPCYQQLFRSKKPLRFWTYICPNLLEVQTFRCSEMQMHGSIFGCIYLFQLKFGNFCLNSAKQTTGMYVHSPLLKTSFVGKVLTFLSRIRI
jgi:hypothetical protein